MYVFRLTKNLLAATFDKCDFSLSSFSTFYKYSFNCLARLG